MKKISKKQLIIIVIVGLVALGFILLTTIGKPLFSKSITAEKIDDLKNVCYGNKITNAAAYTSAKSAVIAAFYEQPHSKSNPWTQLTGDASPYYVNFGEQAKVSVVACFEYQPFGNKQIATCDDIKLMSAHYKTIFYEAKTGKKISEGKELTNDDKTCPSYVVYDKTSRETAKAPNVNDMKAEISTFVGS